MAEVHDVVPLQVHTDRYIREVISLHGGSVGKAAKALGVGRATLYRWVAGRAVAAKPNRNALSVQERRQVRLAAFVDAREAWRSCQNVGAFTRWLEEQITAAGGERRAG